LTDSDTTIRSVVIWVEEGTWRATVDAALSLAPTGARFILLHVTSPAAADTAHGAYRGLLGRGGPDPGERVEALASVSAADLLEAAARRLERPCHRLSMHGNTERAVVTASASAGLLIVARDGDQRPGPHSLGRAGRFIVDHAICRVLVVWPGPPPRDTPGGHRTPGKPDRNRHSL
jgi:hypothetical protein